MEKLRITQKVSRQNAAVSNKRRLTFGVFALCLLLLCGIVVTTALLGEGIGRFSGKEANVIPLVPAQSESPADIKQETQPQLAAEAGSHTVGQQGEYRGEMQVYDDKQAWSSETQVDLFRDSYNDTAKSGDGEKIIAPGTSNFYSFTLKNNGGIPLDYTISLKVDAYSEGQAANSDVPLEWRLLSGDGTVVSDWQGYNGRTAALKQAVLDVRHQDNYTIEWRWIFEKGEAMDENDTNMGNMTVNEPIGVNAAIYVYAEQSVDWDGSSSNLGNAPKTGDTFNILFYILLLVVSGCGLVIIIWSERRRKKRK